jgi:hypothetical protein
MTFHQEWINTYPRRLLEQQSTDMIRLDFIEFIDMDLRLHFPQSQTINWDQSIGLRRAQTSCRVNAFSR